MLETSQLQTLVAVAKAQSFSQAANDLHVTQSAISQSIKNLENKVGVKLFKRSGKKVVLTPEGEKLHAMADQFIGRMHDTLEDIQIEKNTMKGKVRIGTLTGIGKSWLASTMLDYAEKFPELTIVVNLGFQEDLVRQFEQCRLDILILPEEALPNVGEKKLIGEETSILVYPQGEEFHLPIDISLEELSSYPTILFQEKGDGLYLKWCKEHFGAIPKEINKRFIINSHGNMLQAVRQGLGLAVVPRHVFERSHYKDQVKSFSTHTISNGKFFVVYHKDTDKMMRIRQTIDLLTSSDNPLE